MRKNTTDRGGGRFALAMTIAALLAVASFAVIFSTADSDDDAVFGAGELYDPADITVINNIIKNNGLKWTEADPADGSYVPADWDVAWSAAATDKRIIYLDISSKGLTGSLDVSGLGNLIYLHCYSNSLTGLNVSGLGNLIYLHCENNELTELNVSGLSSLTQLLCFYNNLTELNVSGLSNLTGLYCGSNNLTELNVSGLSNLIYLHCADNNLTGLNVSGLSNLTNLDCRYNFIANESDVTGTGDITAFTPWDTDGFWFSPQYAEYNITGKSVDKIQTDLQYLIDNNFIPFVTGSKTNADKKLTLTLDREIFWNAEYKGAGAELELEGYDNFNVIDCSMTLTGLTVDGNWVRVYDDGRLTINGNMNIEDGWLEAWNGGKITVTGNVTADNTNTDYALVYAYSEGEITVGGNIVSSGIGIYPDGDGIVTVNGNVVANGDHAIYCRDDSIVHVKGNVTAKNGNGVRIDDQGTVKIDGTLTAKDDKFVYDGTNYLTAPTATNEDGYYSVYAGGDWRVFVGKQPTSGDNGSTLIFVGVLMVLLAAIAVGYLSFIRPKT
jgi:hypothetical protein